MKSILKSYLLVLLAAAINSSAAPPPGIPDGWTDGYVYANGIRIHYYHAGSNPRKPVMVMVHGVTDNGLCWTTLTWKLQDQYDIYMPDTRGHGLSDPFTPIDDADTLVKDVAEFVRAMKFEKPILMGHSMGAATVMRLGAEDPDLAKAIIMLDPLIGRGGPRPSGTRGLQGERTQTNSTPRTTGHAATARSSESQATTLAHAAERGGPPNASKQLPPARGRLSVNMMGSPETLVTQNNYSYEDLVTKARRENPKWDLVDCEYWALSKKQYHGAYSSAAWQVMSGVMNTGDSLAKITAPAIILKADAPAEVRRANEEIAKVMQRGKLVHIDGAAHNLHHDQLNETARTVTEFLSTLQP
jgi:pimeloyl-ACP methyl ester carboxylesterase